MKEIDTQERYPWERETHYGSYNSVLGHYQVQACLEYATGSSALDIPCGDGFMTAEFAKHFSKVVGVDASQTHLDKAKKRLPEVEFYHELIEDFSYPEKFDNIFMINVLEHVADPVKALANMISLLNSNGRIMIHVPNAEALNRKIAVEMGTLTHCEELSPFDIDIAGHRRSYTLDTLIRDVESAGLKIRQTGGVFLKMLSSPQMDWFLKEGLWKEGGFGWGRVGEENKDWQEEFCRACYVIGKQYPRDCNIVYVVAGL
ncbi:MAG TPA: class I SAM-dependent methyltransferase [Desulfosporosinus sp.]|nr:class I SAM-dependent methyltransferase [Desulfosporosinus sp.]